MAKIYSTLHPDGYPQDDLYPNIQRDNIPNKAINESKLDDALLNLINSGKSGSPSYVGLASQILALTSNQGLAVATDSGNWFYWNGSKYVDSGLLYQNYVIDNGTIDVSKLANDVITLLNSDENSYIFIQPFQNDVILNKSGKTLQYTGGKVSDYIAIESGDKFYVTGVTYLNGILIATYSSNKTFLRWYVESTDIVTQKNYVYTPQSDEKYVRFSSVNNKFVVALLRNKRLNKYTIDNINNINNIIYFKDTYDKDVTNEYSLMNGFINYNTGSFVRSNDALSTDYIELNSNDVYHITAKAQYETCIIATYNQSHNLIRTIYNVSDRDIGTIYNDYEFTPQDGEIFVRFCSYLAPLKIVKKVNYTVKDRSSGNILSGKKYVACGDSFTDGDALASDKVYPYLIAERNNMNLVNMAKNGTYAHYGDAGFVNPNNSYYYKNIPEDADYITIAYGLNEINQPLGDSSSTDNTTIWGAYNEILDWLITNRPNAKIGIISNDAWMTQSFKNTLKEIALYWGVSFLDLKGNDVPLMIGGKYDPISQKAITLRSSQYMISASNSHPNEKGHQVRSTIIENWLRSF